MHRVIFAIVLALFALREGSVAAQEGAPPPVQLAPSVEIITTAPNQTAASQVYFQSDLDEASESIRRTRIALISTSAVFAVGIIFASIGASQCTYHDYYYSRDYVCNNAGDVLLPLGGGFLGAGTIGMLTSGIMLGVKKGQRRKLQREMRRSYYGGRLQWDIESGRLVF